MLFSLCGIVDIKGGRLRRQQKRFLLRSNEAMAIAGKAGADWRPKQLIIFICLHRTLCGIFYILASFQRQHKFLFSSSLITYFAPTNTNELTHTYVCVCELHIQIRVECDENDIRCVINKQSFRKNGVRAHFLFSMAFWFDVGNRRISKPWQNSCTWYYRHAHA